VSPKLDAAHSIVRKTGVPAGWTEYAVGDIVDIVGGGTPDRSEAAYWREGTIPWITPTDLTANSSKYIKAGAENITERALKESNATLVQRDAIIFSTRGSVGKLALAANPLTCNQSCEILVAREGKVNPEFLYYLLNFGMNAYHRLAGGTTFGAITRRDIKRVHFVIPPPAEQAAIARILDAVDTAIERTRDAAARALDGKQALIFDLLTGKMRVGKSGDKVETSYVKEFDARHTFLRRFGVPAGWEAIQLGKLAKIVGGGTPSREESRYWAKGTIAWATPTDITANNDKYLYATAEYISEVGMLESAATLLPIGTVLFTSRATIGAKAITQIPITTNQGFASFIPHADKITKDYLYYLLDILTPTLIRLGSGTTFLEVSKRDIKRVWCAIPPLEEQEEIGQILAASDKMIAVLKQKVERLQTLKKSLMHDLLSGQKRVGGVNQLTLF
jgi:type I restriction enzyme, S subunit